VRYFSAHYVFTNSGPILKRPVICVENDGTIISVEDTSGELDERHSLEFFNGIIVPGFVNCHCHLELSWMKGKIPERTGLGGFLSGINSIRALSPYVDLQLVKEADEMMNREGVVLCADICNTPVSFVIKKKSKIKYINLLEVYGIDSIKAEKRIEEIMQVAARADEEQLRWQLVPHSVYSISAPLFRLLKEKTGSNTVTSIHFMETPDEELLLSEQAGALMDAYRNILTPASVISPVKDHSAAILEEVTESGNLVLVHNTFISKEIIQKLKKRMNIFYCLCPNSNIHIGGNIPPVRLLADEKCNIVVGTDSLASNKVLSIISELKTLQDNFQEISLEEIIRWATINGARALGEERYAGTIEPGKKPGLVLIEDADLNNIRLLACSTSRRLI